MYTYWMRSLFLKVQSLYKTTFKASMLRSGSPKWRYEPVHWEMQPGHLNPRFEPVMISAVPRSGRHKGRGWPYKMLGNKYLFGQTKVEKYGTFLASLFRVMCNDIKGGAGNMRTVLSCFMLCARKPENILPQVHCQKSKVLPASEILREQEIKCVVEREIENLMLPKVDSQSVLIPYSWSFFLKCKCKMDISEMSKCPFFFLLFFPPS